MNNRIIRGQFNNYKTIDMYTRQFMTLAENVFRFKNLPNFIDIAYLNKTLINQGRIAFFVDDEIGLVALPFTSFGNLDIYGRPNKIQVCSQNGYNRVLNKKDYVIMYDNLGCYPLFVDVIEYATRYAIITRTIDVNVSQQKTARVWQVPSGLESSLKRIFEEVDSYSEVISSYDNFNLEELNCVLQPSPYVSDKLVELKKAIKNEFLELIGISNIQYNKKERMITDEIVDSQGNTIASRYNRYETRRTAIEEINKKFSDYLEKPIEVCYYDNIPSSEDEMIKNASYEEGSKDD